MRVRYQSHAGDSREAMRKSSYEKPTHDIVIFKKSMRLW